MRGALPWRLGGMDFFLVCPLNMVCFCVIFSSLSSIEQSPRVVVFRDGGFPAFG
jgi:hypothetical protein